MPETLIDIKDLNMHFPASRKGLLGRKHEIIRAVDGVSLSINRGETMGIVGESGSGKSTLGLCTLQLQRPTSGRVLYDGRDLCRATANQLRDIRRRLQIIFQDPYGSLDPRMTAAAIISEAFEIHRLLPKPGYRDRVRELLDLVGLEKELADRYPHEFSAGQRQRVGIARALAVKPDFIVCDEPVSALDVCVQAQVLDLLQDLQRRLGLTYMFIAHDLAVVGRLSNRIAVMHRGKIVELGPAQRVITRPLHPYTRALIAAVPVPDPAVERVRHKPVAAAVEDTSGIEGPGCTYRVDCPEQDDSCPAVPALTMAEPGHWVACRRAPP